MLVSHPLCRLLVSFAGTKHCCLTAINRDGALCCPDFPRDRGLKPMLFFPYLAIDRCTISKFAFSSKRSLLLILFPYREPRGLEVREGMAATLMRSAFLVASPFRRRAAYGNRTRLLGLGSRCTTDVLMPQNRCKITTFF